MNKWSLLPKLSVLGIKKNGNTYIPYIIAGIFSVFVFFVFSSILHNDIMKTLPHSSYVMMLMIIGLVLLGMILIPFLMYTNSFLMKRRKKELGLYSILGLEKKHIGMMMIWETLIICSIVTFGGILFGVVFSKLLFLILLNLSGMPVDTHFFLSFASVKETVLFFLVAYGLNLLINLFQVYRSNPNELMKGAKRGDKEPKHLWITALLGILLLGAGYTIAFVTELNSMIFGNTFLAISFVSFGTHLFFKAGTIALLKIMKKNKKLYYQKSNYVTISGMLYRMKKSASSLANICIFSTMTIITIICTVSLWSGTDSILNHQYPYDIIINFNTKDFDQYNEVSQQIREMAENAGIGIKDKIAFTYQKLHVIKEEKTFLKAKEESESSHQYAIKLISLEDYNQMEGKDEQLEDNEVLIFATGADFGYNQVVLNKYKYDVEKELQEIVFTQKAVNDTFGEDYYIIVKDHSILDKLESEFGSSAKNDRIYTIRYQINGTDQNKEKYIQAVSTWCKDQEGFNSFRNGIFGRKDMISLNGGLLFIGIFFGIVFSMCLILIMYYKQITEGFDDRENFDIMQKVGMSDREVRETIKRQILMVFFLPLFMAIIHTMVALEMVAKLLGVLNLFDTTLIFICSMIVMGTFTLLYGLSYLLTSKAYYRIVKQMN